MQLVWHAHQGLHDCFPVKLWYVPGVQGWQVLWPVLDEKLPAVQFVQLLAPTLPACLPVEHALQAPPLLEKEPPGQSAHTLPVAIATGCVPLGQLSPKLRRHSLPSIRVPPDCWHTT